MSSSKYDSLHGNLIAITGAGSGIGRSLAHLLASSGALLSLADVSADAVQQVAKELTDNGLDEKNVFWKKVDVADLKEVEEWVEETVARFGRKLDGAANLAGISGILQPLRTYSQADFRNVFSVNVEGIFNCLSAQLRNVREANPPLNPNAAVDAPNTSTPGVESTGGSIVNAASVAGLVGKPNCSVYCASKFAVIGITKSAANEEGQRGSGIRVNAIAPAFVQTPMMEGIDKITGDPLPHGSVFGRRAYPEEVAKVIRFLLSGESSYITGSVYQIDGGMLC